MPTIIGLEDCYGTNVQSFQLTVPTAGTLNLLFIEDGVPSQNIEMRLLDANNMPVDNSNWGAIVLITQNLDPNETYNLEIRGTGTVGSDILLGAQGLGLIQSGISTVASTDCTPMPVTWLGEPSLEMENSLLRVSWHTIFESNCSHFEPQFSVNGQDWKQSKKISCSEESTDQNSYSSIIDTKDISGNTIYVRIKQIDFDGNYSYSSVSSLSIERGNKISFFPNPAKNILHISSINPLRSVKILNLSGKEIFSGNQTDIDLGSFAQGMYMIMINDIHGNSKFSKLIRE